MIYFTIPPPPVTPGSDDEVGPPPFLRVHTTMYNYQKDHQPNHLMVRNPTLVELFPHQWHRIDLPLIVHSDCPAKFIILADQRTMFIRRLSQMVISSNTNDNYTYFYLKNDSPLPITIQSNELLLFIYLYRQETSHQR